MQKLENKLNLPLCRNDYMRCILQTVNEKNNKVNLVRLNKQQYNVV